MEFIKFFYYRIISLPIFRFIIIGGINTLLSWFFFYLFLKFFSYIIAYTLVYGLGIIFSYYLNTFFVFNKKFEIKKLIQYPIVYLVQYIIGILTIYVLVDEIGINKQMAIIFTTIINIPITFILSKSIIAPNSTKE